MSLWSGIKYAINSTLGTNEFQPLDQMIKSQRAFGSSDTIIAVLGSAISNQWIPKAFVAKTGGVVNVTGTVSVGASGATLSIYENGNLYESLDVSNGEDNYSFEISVKKDCAYTFKSGNGMVVSVKIGAQIIDGSLFETQDIPTDIE